MSVANLNYNVIFIHVPKTAGSSMEHREFTGGGGHQDIRTYKRIFELGFIGLPKWEDMFKFGFVRHPYERAAAAFASHYSVGGNQSEVNLGHERTPEGFTRFLVEQEQQLKANRWTHFIPQCSYLCVPMPGGSPYSIDGGIGVDFVGRFENLQEDWNKVCARVGVSNELSHWLKGDFGDYNILYTPQAKEILRSIYEKDFEVFGYGA